jgi:hypothetical protein
LTNIHELKTEMWFPQDAAPTPKPDTPSHLASRHQTAPVAAHISEGRAGGENALFLRHFQHKMIVVAKTGSGQT